MNEEELQKIIEIKTKIEEQQAQIEKILDPKEIQNLLDKKNAQDIINKDIHVVRGRLLKTYKVNRDYIEELFYKYDMYINIYNILDREENDNYTATDKINDIKNSTIKTEYTPFEEKILNMIQANLDNLENMKKELDELDENHGIRDLIELKATYQEELKKHKENINSRYKNEFLRKKATLPTIFTVLPKAIGLACKKVANCIREQKEARTNKSKLDKFVKTLGAIGQVAATPVIYAGKFAIDHWYLLLLLLLRFPKIKWPWKPKDDDKKYEEHNEQPQEQEAVEYELSPAKEPSPVLVGEGDRESVPVQDPFAKPAIDYAHDPRFQAPKEPVAVAAEPARPAIDYAHDPRFQAQKEPVAVEPAAPVPQVDHKPAIDYAHDPRFQKPTEVAVKQEQIAHDAMEEYNVTPNQVEQLNEQYHHTIERLNERSNGQFFIREIDGANVEYPDVVVCRTPMEYLLASSKLCDLDPASCGFIDANGLITPEGYRFMIERNIGTFGQNTMTDPIIFEDPDGQYYDEFAKGYGSDIRNMYDRFTTVRCFETVEEFNAALVSDNHIYDGMRQEFVREMNVSESQEALQCLEALGLIAVGGAAVEVAAPAIAAGIANLPELADGLKGLLDLLQLSPANEIGLEKVIEFAK